MEPVKKRTFSPVWEFFELINPNKVKCLLCSKELVYSDNTSSMLRHFRALHEIKDNAPGPSQGYKREEQDQALLAMIVDGTLPISIVDNRGFQTFVDKLDPTYILPTKEALHAMMEMEFERQDEPIKTEAAPMAETFLMEVCVDSVESAVNAQRGGAGRLELCSSLLEGGLTPSLGLLQVVKQCVRIPIYVMIRPRGGDFLYSDQEVEVMKKDIELMKSHGADGLVLGALTEDGRVDAELCTELLAVARPLPVTFHRAFDMVHDPVVALETVVKLGFERVLTSGCDISAMEGLPLIKRLVDKAKGRIIIMPGGGITERNLQRILEGSGAQEFHCSARSSRESAMKFRNTSVKMTAGFSPPEFVLQVADVSKVHTLNAIARNTL